MLRSKYAVVFFCVILLLINLATAVVGRERSWPATWYAISEIAVGAVVALACWQAARRSTRFSRQFWTLVGLAFAIWCVGQILIAYFVASGSPVAAFWPTAIFFFLFAAPIAMTLFLNEESKRTMLDWPQSLDLLQIIIASVAAFLVLFYVPTLRETSDAVLADRALRLHVLRDALLAAAFAFRGLTTGSRVVRALFWRMSAFWAAYGASAAVYFYGYTRWQGTPEYLLELAPDLSLLLLVVAAATWRGEGEHHAIGPRRRVELAWAQWLPLMFPVLVVSMAANLPHEEMVLAWITVLASVMCSAARVAVANRRQRRSLAALEKSEEKYAKLFHASPDCITVSHLSDGRYQEVNDEFLRLTGYTREETLGHTSTDIGLWDGPDGRADLVAALEARGRVRGYESRFRNRQGEVRAVQISAEIMQLAGEPALVAVTRDVTEAKQTEQALRESESNFRALAENASAAIYIFDDSRILYANPATQKILGYSREELLSIKDPIELVAPEYREQARQRIGRRLDGQSVPDHAQFPMLTKTGALRWLDTCGSPIQFQGKPAVVGIAVDITDRRRAQEHLQQAQKMEAVGSLAAAVSHDFNNVLTIIQGYSDILLERLGSSHPSHRELREIRQAAERGSRLSQQLLAFSRKQVLQPRNVDLNAVTMGVEGMLRTLVGKRVEVVASYARDLGTVKADPGQIEQVLMNLAANARDAMPKGGQLFLQTSNTVLTEEFTRRNPGSRTGRYAVLTVRDTGTGMDAETQARMFEPFFTTKQPGRGTGLGLATVYGIVKQSSGYIHVQSEPGCGTRFDIYLPRVDRKLETPGLAEAQGEAAEKSSVLHN